MPRRVSWIRERLLDALLLGWLQVCVIAGLRQLLQDRLGGMLLVAGSGIVNQRDSHYGPHAIDVNCTARTSVGILEKVAMPWTS
jgi:hypothetical protein